MRAMGLLSFYRKDWAEVHDKQMASICIEKQYSDRCMNYGIRRQIKRSAYWVCQDSGNTGQTVTYRGAK